jgi:Mannosyl-glycoprotein endo-beta-N-acetylglucosaminidase
MQIRTRDHAALRRAPTPHAPRRLGWRRAAVAIGAAAFGLTACFAPVGPPPVGAGTIMGPSELTAAQIAAYVCHVGRCATWLPEISPQQMAQLYIDEGNLVGVRGDIAFSQAVLETGWFAFLGSPAQNLVPAPAPGDSTWPGFVLPRDHNYAGLGAFPGSTVFMRMPTPQDGVRAQLQHLRNYADAGSRHDNLGAPFETRPGYDANTFDHFLYKGQAPRWVDLDGRWAVPGTTYGQTILSIDNNMRTFAGLAPIASSGLSASSLLTTPALHATTTDRH